MSEPEAVVCIHGFGGHWLVMMPLARRLAGRGYRVRNWGYRSIWKTTARHADQFALLLDQLQHDPAISRFHIVAHSMGSIVTRVALAQLSPSKLHRVVMLAPPNLGSHVATRFVPWFGWLSTTLREISDLPDSLVRQLDEPIAEPYEVGIIQASTDFVVRDENTHLPEAKETVMTSGFHSSILWRKRTSQLIETFLSEGTFESNF